MIRRKNIESFRELAADYLMGLTSTEISYRNKFCVDNARPFYTMPPGVSFSMNEAFFFKTQFCTSFFLLSLVLGSQSGPEAGSFTLVSPGFGPALTSHVF